MKEPLAEKMCSCIEKVSKSFNAKNQSQNKNKNNNKSRKANKSRAIAICVKSILQKKRGRTLKQFSCGDTPKLVTQALKN